jgi:Protein of unknown function (Hypoth_ymh)
LKGKLTFSIAIAVAFLGRPRAAPINLSEIDTESGRNDQVGFMEIYRGFYRGVRNPKAHSLMHDLDANKAAQHLVLASILMRRVVDAHSVP